MSLSVMQIDNFDGNFDFNSEFVTLYTTATITAGNWVAFVTNDASNPGAIDGVSVITAISTTAGAPSNTCGICTDTVTVSGAVQTPVRVQICGKYATANVVTTTADGVGLAISNVSGQAQAASASTTNDFRTIGRALSAATVGNVAEVEIFPHPFFIR